MSDGADVEVATTENPTSEIESPKGKSALTSRRPLSTVHPFTPRFTSYEHVRVWANEHLPVPETPEQQGVVEEYTISSSINDYLRGFNSESDFSDDVRIMDSMMGSMPAEMNLFRTVDVNKMFPEGFPKPGDVSTDPAYLSTNLDREFSGFAGNAQHPVYLVLRVPSGTPGVFVGEINGHDQENEVILGRGLTLEVTSAELTVYWISSKGASSMRKFSSSIEAESFVKSLDLREDTVPYVRRTVFATVLPQDATQTEPNLEAELRQP